jgi:uncharacterized protein
LCLLIYNMLQKLLYFIFIFLFLSAIAMILWISDLFLSLWEKLIQQPSWFIGTYIFIFSIFVLFSIIVLYRLLPKHFFFKQSLGKSNHTQKKDQSEPVDIQQIENRVDLLEQKNIDLSKAKKEIEELKAAQIKKDIRIVLFGDISSGKSSLIRAIIPQAEGDISVLGGTTREVINYQWTSPLGERLILSDTPGFDEQKRLLDELSRETVYKSHLAVYLCEGDLTASQLSQIKEIAVLGKPLLVAFNKTDRYLNEDVDIISKHIQTYLDSIDRQIKLIHIQTGGSKEVTLHYPDGTDKTEMRQLKPDLSKLLTSIAKTLEKTTPTELESIRQKSVLRLLSNNIDQVEVNYRKEQSLTIVNSSTKKALIASMATITPGSDLLIQGYLAMAMIKDLCHLYEVPAKEMDIESLLELLQKNTIGVFPLLLGIAGNGFKAFPGAGTLAGGLLHAVAYGLIFDSVGKAVSLSLATQGELLPILVEDIYKEKLVENIESRALELVKMVIKSKTDSKSG